MSINYTRAVFINSGSEHCSVIAVYNSPVNPGVLIPLYLYFFFVGVLPACLVIHCFLKKKNILHPILCLSSYI